MNWFSLSLLSIIALATAELSQQQALNKSKKLDERASTVFTFLIPAVMALPLIYLMGLTQEFLAIFNADIFPYFIGAGVFASLAIFYYFKSFRVKNISFSSIFVSLSLVVSTILGVIFFNETLYPMKVLGVGLVLGSIISVNINNLQLEKNHFYGLLAGVLFGVVFIFDKKVVGLINPVVYLFWATFIVAVVVYFVFRKDVAKAIQYIDFNAYKFVLLSGIGYFFYNLFTFVAYTLGGEVGRVDTINNSQVFLIILVEYFVLKHKKGFARKLITALVAFAGVMILGLY